MYNTDLTHHGVKGQEWGERNGPPYPLNREGKDALRAQKKRAKAEKLIRSINVTQKYADDFAIKKQYAKDHKLATAGKIAFKTACLAGASVGLTSLSSYAYVAAVNISKYGRQIQRGVDAVESAVNNYQLKETVLKENVIKETMLYENTIKEATIKPITVTEATVKPITVTKATVKPITINEARVQSWDNAAKTYEDASKYYDTIKKITNTNSASELVGKVTEVAPKILNGVGTVAEYAPIAMITMEAGKLLYEATAQKQVDLMLKKLEKDGFDVETVDVVSEYGNKGTVNSKRYNLK